MCACVHVRVPEDNLCCHSQGLLPAWSSLSSPGWLIKRRSSCSKGKHLTTERLPNHSEVSWRNEKLDLRARTSFPCQAPELPSFCLKYSPTPTSPPHTPSCFHSILSQQCHPATAKTCGLHVFVYGWGLTE